MKQKRKLRIGDVCRVISKASAYYNEVGVIERGSYTDFVWVGNDPSRIKGTISMHTFIDFTQPDFKSSINDPNKVWEILELIESADTFLTKRFNTLMLY